MPVECHLLAHKSIPFEFCPACGSRFFPFLRGLVQRRWNKWFFWGHWPHCALICTECKEIVGYECPYSGMLTVRLAGLRTGVRVHQRHVHAAEAASD